jgi:hypothetical protein
MTEGDRLARSWAYLARWRWYPVPATFLAFTIAFYIGATAQLSAADASELVQLWGQVFSGVKSPIDIFLNNYQIALYFTIPIVGAPFAMYESYFSGLVIAAMAQANKADPVMVVILTLANPVGVLEFMGYALSITQGILIVYAVARKHLKKEIRNTAITLALVLAILMLSAFIEFELVKGFLNP